MDQKTKKLRNQAAGVEWTKLDFDGGYKGEGGRTKERGRIKGTSASKISPDTSFFKASLKALVVFLETSNSQLFFSTKCGLKCLNND